MSKRKPGELTETQESIDFARWLRRRRLLFCHVPNEGRRGAREAATLQRMGVSSGVPDFLVFSPPPKFVLGVVTIDGAESYTRARGVGVEMKRARGGRVSATQAKWIADLECVGWVAFAADGSKDAIARMAHLGYPLS